MSITIIATHFPLNALPKEIRLEIQREKLTIETLNSSLNAFFSLSHPTLKYEDDEGDKITLRSDIELAEALRQVEESKNKLLKIFLTEESTSSREELQLPFILKPDPFEPDVSPPPLISTPTPSSLDAPDRRILEEIPSCPLPPIIEEAEESSSFCEDDELVIHGINCDACGFPIIGIRWKCSVCPAANFCETCERIVDHIEDHPLLRIKVPLPPSYPQIPTLPSTETVCSTTTTTTTTPSSPSSVWGEFKKVLTQPQVVKATTAAKRLSTDMTQMLTNLSDQMITQTKEVGMDLGQKVSQNTSRLIGLWQNLSLSESKAPQTNDEKLQPYKLEIEALEEMGFNCREFNELLLKKHHGNLEAALAEMLN